ncbi:minor tail protein [Mycobacterium phage Indlulamithi]|uniref:Minor tail protein n=1 Tax=Mycobacterium phage Indlulamithi TaxID=2656582 RepID=A0A649VCK6_9CAUD|nr:minor tail protein [Mycobacterium phage Indlulamithi]QGJ90068.1 minor tail protein [Mycobacterium phage Indlulamithi]
MTAFLSPAGIGAPASTSTDTRALKAINSRNLSYANKDFVKNMAWLNSSVDTLSQWSQKLQAGVDSANQNAIEQIQGFAADLFVLFAGLEPTGVDIGDLKYVIQGIGALLGINPDTPFPMNLLEAAGHLFSTYIIPLPQFSDVIFDAIDAWAVDLGLSPEFIQAMHDLQDAIEALGENFSDLFNSIGQLLEVFGPDFGPVGQLWNALMDLLDGVDTGALKPVISLLADLGIPFIQALTAIVNAGNAFLDPLGTIAGSQIASLGQNIVPKVSADTTVWSVGSNNVNAWVLDAAQSASGTDGSFTTLGNGQAKRILTQKTFQCKTGQKFTVKGSLRWNGIPTGTTEFGAIIVWYSDANEVSTTTLNIPAGHGATGGWTQSISYTDVTVPNNVNGFKIGARVGTTVTTGQVWADDLSMQLQGTIDQGLIAGLTQTLSNFLNFDFFDDIIGSPGQTPESVADWFLSFLTENSPIPGLNIIGSIPGRLLQNIGIGSIGGTAPNLLENPGFDTAVALDGEGIWTWDGTIGRSAPLGSAKVMGTGVFKELQTKTPIQVDQGQKLNLSGWVTWTGLGGYASNPIALGISTYSDIYGQNLVASVEIGNAVGGAGANSGFVQVSGQYQIPVGVASVRVRLILKATATAGQVNFDDLYLGKVQLLNWNLVDGLNDAWQGLLDTLGGGIGSVIEDIGNRLFALNPDGTLDASQLANMLNIPAINPLKVLGISAPTIVDTFRNTLEQLWGGLARSLDYDGKSLADVASQANNTSETADTALQVGEWNNALLGLRNNKSLFEGMDETEESNFTMDSMMIAGQADPPIINATAASSPGSIWRAKETAKKGFISYWGRGITNVTGLYLDIYKFNTATQTLALMHTSPNQIGVHTANWGLNVYYLPAEARFDVASGDVVLVCWRVTGTGTFQLAGIQSPWMTNHPTVIPRRPAVALPSGGPFNGVALSALDSYYSNNIPWFGIGIATGDVPPPYYAPRQTQLTQTGQWITWPIPTWANFVDVVLASGAGGGHGGDGGFGNSGQGGKRGNWGTETLQRGVDFPSNATQLQFFIGVGGTAGAKESNGGNGQASARAAITGGKAQLTVAGGLGATGYDNNGSNGESLPNLDYLGVPYTGGLGAAYNGGDGEAGQSPGGGGGGGQGGVYTVAWPGGKGGDGRGFVTARQS